MPLPTLRSSPRPSDGVPGIRPSRQVIAMPLRGWSPRSRHFAAAGARSPTCCVSWWPGAARRILCNQRSRLEDSASEDASCPPSGSITWQGNWMVRNGGSPCQSPLTGPTPIFRMYSCFWKGVLTQSWWTISPWAWLGSNAVACPGCRARMGRSPGYRLTTSRACCSASGASTTTAPCRAIAPAGGNCSSLGARAKPWPLLCIVYGWEG